jgi:hypothetical protein
LGDIDEAGRWLYANFCKHQQDSGIKNTIAMKRFSNNLRDLLKNQMKVAITEGRDAQGRFIQGLGLRCNLDPTGKHYPCPVTKKPFCDGFMTDDVGLVTVESHTDAGFAGYAGFSENLKQTEKQQIEISSALPPNQFTSPPNQTCGGDGDKKPANPPNPASASPVPDTKPAQEDINPALMQSPPSSPAIKRPHKKFKVGDRVVVKDVGGMYQGARGKVVDNIYSRAGGSYLVKFDKPIRNSQQSEFDGSDLMKL